MGLIFQIFLSGLIMGVSLCGLHCCFLLFPLVVKESQKKIDVIKIGISFGISKIFVYGIIGGLSSLIGTHIQNIIQRRTFSYISGIILILTGLWFLLPIKKHIKIFKSSIPVLLGIIEGIIPCVPLMGLVFYLAYISKSFYFGFISGSLFGLGSIIFPVGVICGFFPYFFYKFFLNVKVRILFKFLGFCIFSLWGINIILSSMKFKNL